MESWYLLYCKRGQLLRAQEHLERQQVNCLSPIITLEKIVRGKRIAVSEPCFPTTCLWSSTRSAFTPPPSAPPAASATSVRFGALPSVIPSKVIDELRTHASETYVDPETPQPGTPF